MSRSTVCYASPKIARQLAKVFGDRVEKVKVTMRGSQDVPEFIRKVALAHKQAAKSSLQFD